MLTSNGFHLENSIPENAEGKWWGVAIFLLPACQEMGSYSAFQILDGMSLEGRLKRNAIAKLQHWKKKWSHFDSNILQLLGISGQILVQPVTQLLVKVTPFFLSVLRLCYIIAFQSAISLPMTSIQLLPLWEQEFREDETNIEAFESWQLQTF